LGSITSPRGLRRILRGLRRCVCVCMYVHIHACIHAHIRCLTYTHTHLDQNTHTGQVAINMVEKLGMSPKIGIVSYGSGGGGRRGGSDRSTASEETRAAIDQEVKRLTDESYRRAKKLLRSRIGELHALAEALLDKETLTGEEVTMCLKPL
jgi:ATP-dependent Zn protease